MTHCFIDSNLWLYTLLTDPLSPDEDEQKKRTSAIDLIDHATPFISTQVVNEVCSVLRRKAKWSEAQTKELVLTFQASCTITQITEQTLLLACDLRLQYGFSFWDGLIVASALEANVDTLYSEDMQHGLQVEKLLTIQNPFSVLEHS
jgi:predicted nucleic acid-binding protein